MILSWMSSFLKFWCWCLLFWHVVCNLVYCLAFWSFLPTLTQVIYLVLQNWKLCVEAQINEVWTANQYCFACQSLYYQLSHSNILLLYLPCLFSGIFACQPTTISQMPVLQQLMLFSLDRKLWENDWKIAHTSKQSSDISMLFSNLCNHSYWQCH
jgi:hypothetical protein